MSGLTRAEMDARIAARDAERDRPLRRRAVERAPKLERKTPTPAPSPFCALFCALCTTDIPRPAIAPPNWTPRQEPLGKNDALVSCCERCATERVPERDHLFSSSLGVGQDGVGYGNRHRGPQRR